MAFFAGTTYDWYNRFHQNAWNIADFNLYIAEGNSYIAALDLNYYVKWVQEARKRKTCLTNDGTYWTDAIFSTYVGVKITTEGGIIFITEDGTPIVTETYVPGYILDAGGNQILDSDGNPILMTTYTPKVLGEDGGVMKGEGGEKILQE
jgi:hypothetical protein